MEAAFIKGECANEAYITSHYFGIDKSKFGALAFESQKVAQPLVFFIDYLAVAVFGQQLCVFVVKALVFLAQVIDIGKVSDSLVGSIGYKICKTLDVDIGDIMEFLPDTDCE